jgi:hypothetical protein
MDSPKYNRTYHMPWSEGCTNDDKRATSVDSLLGKEIVLTEKMDGSNTSIESTGCYARTHAGPPTHKSFDQLKALHASVKHHIPEDSQLFGEWCYAKHSIEYAELPAYFLLFNIRYLSEDDNSASYWAAWDTVETYAKLFGLTTVPVLFRGTVNSEKELKDLVESLMQQPSACGGIREGVVARIADAFDDKDFSSCVMKCVRANHVQTSEHWKDQEIVKNKLKLTIVGS